MEFEPHLNPRGRTSTTGQASIDQIIAQASEFQQSSKKTVNSSSSTQAHPAHVIARSPQPLPTIFTTCALCLSPSTWRNWSSIHRSVHPITPCPFCGHSSTIYLQTVKPTWFMTCKASLFAADENIRLHATSLVQGLLILMKALMGEAI
jgi:hypothetical protein